MGVLWARRVVDEDIYAAIVGIAMTVQVRHLNDVVFIRHVDIMGNIPQLLQGGSHHRCRSIETQINQPDTNSFLLSLFELSSEYRRQLSRIDSGNTVNKDKAMTNEDES